MKLFRLTHGEMTVFVNPEFIIWIRPDRWGDNVRSSIYVQGEESTLHDSRDPDTLLGHMRLDGIIA